MTVDKLSVEPQVRATASGASAANGNVAASGFDGVLGSTLERMVTSTRDTIGKSEALSAQAIAGKASLSQVVSAVNEAELALQTVMSIRDRVISAYQDIMKMPI
ncbi:MAG: flagellar hook-basal body complex protein FliE [Alphaproteobacteria bacterium]|nr:flagellar hook-basal body complex protein FliE [Alphaproteobacteria bacterium]